VLLVLEDLHWGDLPTVNYLDRALGQLQALPLMVLALARPEVRELFPRLWTERDLQDVRLSGLGKRAAETLARDALGESADAAKVAEMVERADGNAFFLEELVRGVAEGRQEVAPETVLAVVEARLGRLEPDARRVLRAGSVFGRAFSAEGAQALVRDVEVGPWIDLLVQRELLARRTEPRDGDGDELVFRHALVREGAYAMLTDEDRTLGHRLAAAWLEEVGDHDAMTLAEHHHRGGEPQHAAAYYGVAAEEALRSSDFAAAVARAERSVTCGASGVALGRLRLIQAEACRWAGDTQRAVEHAEDAAALLPRASADWFRAAAELCVASGRLGEYDLLERVLDDALTLEVDGPAKSAQIIACCPAASQLLQAGRTSAADRMLSRLESLSRSAPLDPVARARLDQVRGFQALRAGNPAHARRAYRAAYEAFERTGSVRNTLIEQINFTHASIELGLFEEAEECLRTTLAPAEALGLSAVHAFALLNLGRALAAQGRADEAKSAQLVAKEIGQAESSPRIEGAARIHLSDIALAAGDAAEAEREARAAVELLEVAPPLQAGALAALSRALLADGRVADALEAATRARETVVAGGSEMSEAAIRLAYAEALARSGGQAAADAELQATATRLRAQAAHFGDPALVAAYLGRVEANARIIRRAGER
jgi:tetratricopeptide (TPR) repeat protein